MEYIKKIFENKILVALGAIWAFIYQLCFPESSYAVGALAVLGIMALDLLTKLFALSRQSGGMMTAIRSHCINSKSLARGTLDKLVVFVVMLIICGLAYRISPISDIAVWFTQMVYAIMFFRDLLSIIENLNDAGIDTGAFKRIIKRKQKEVLGDIEEEESDKID
jgi:phage-related holin